MQAKLQGLASTPTLILLSGAEEYLAPSLTDYPALGQRMVNAAGGKNAKLVVVEGGKHGLEGHEEEAVGHMIEFIKTLDA